MVTLNVCLTPDGAQNTILYLSSTNETVVPESGVLPISPVLLDPGECVLVTMSGTVVPGQGTGIVSLRVYAVGNSFVSDPVTFLADGI